MTSFSPQGFLGWGGGLRRRGVMYFAYGCVIKKNRPKNRGEGGGFQKLH